MAQLLGIVLQPILVPLGWFSQILTSAGALGIFLGIFAAGAVARLFVQPFLGGDGKGDN